MQDDDLQPLLTVLEAMNIAASLKMSSKYTQKEKKSRVSSTSINVNTKIETVLNID